MSRFPADSAKEGGFDDYLPLDDEEDEEEEDECEEDAEAEEPPDPPEGAWYEGGAE